MSVDCVGREDSLYISAATIDLTEDCNLRCSYCFTSGKTKKTLKKDTADRVMEWLVRKDVSGDNKVIDITFWGGEPLLGLKMIKHIVEKGKEITKRLNGEKIFKYGMTTNGTLLTPDTVKYLNKEGIGHLISVDGTKETHDLYRKTVDGKGSFDQVLQGIRNMKASGKDTSIRLSITPQGTPNLYNDIKWFLDNEDIHYFHYSPVYEYEWTDEVVEELRRQFDKLYDLIIKSFDEDKPIRIRPFLFGVTSILYPDRKHFKAPCGAGKTYISISVDGEIYPCHRFHDFCDTREWEEQEKCIGHIDVGFTNDAFRGEFLAFNSRAQVDPEVSCFACDVYKKGECRGGCFASNHDLTGSIVKCPEFECVFNKLQIEYGRRLVEYFKKHPKYLSLYVEGRGDGSESCRCNMACYGDQPDFCECYSGCYNDTMPMVRMAEREKYLEDNIQIEILEAKIRDNEEVSDEDLINIIKIAKDRVRR